ncbi:TadA family conjugal transfer-associated ATPase [Pseudoclavibacter caeni]|uniref:TadA family conjugal transfer-associated ATPase n=1 Tax=Pseudoclavibacter caeni TaxID=908846 RepID=A0A7C8BP44_9MICO|nr:TadA family conjugal transfer-associated ATPase [Pseudoclavibacter caeni]KAB1633463.1 TadA family conjugal transfer-associated ATPase [Pseudoclavibacter caeni]NYJ96548.1 pilus assembly protein CpaF [Pseudoclavibacter caeni]
MSDAERRHGTAGAGGVLGLLGPLRTLVELPDVTDVLVTGPGRVWIDRGRGMERVPLGLGGPDRLRALATALIAAGGRHLDDATPFADVRLGSLRVHAVLPPIAVGDVQLSIRVPRAGLHGLDALAAAGMIDPTQRALLERLVADSASLLISGGTAAGKTTLLRALLERVPADERIVCVEDVAELAVRHPHVVQLEARQANADGRGEVGLEALLRQSLRMRPDRIVVGECRGPELMLLLAALNTGHRGGAGTLHANSIEDVPARLEAMALLAGVGERALARQAASAFDALLHVTRHGGRRRLEAVGRLEVGVDGRLHARRLGAGSRP